MKFTNVTTVTLLGTGIYVGLVLLGPTLSGFGQVIAFHTFRALGLL